MTESDPERPYGVAIPHCIGPWLDPLQFVILSPWPPPRCPASTCRWLCSSARTR